LPKKETESVRKKAYKLDLYLDNSDKQILDSITNLGQIIELKRKEKNKEQL